MTLKERIIVEVYTGICMTSGEERGEVYKYMAELMGRPVYTHELASKEVQVQLKGKSKADFVALCRNSEKNEPEWIYCSEKMPPVETEVYILAKRKYTAGNPVYICTTAFYEDGTVRENDSDWGWVDIDGEWDDEEECYIVPEGWWEYRHYNPDDVYNNTVDDEVIAWRPLPEKPVQEV